ncbi:MAG TPA: DUF6230 family protein [Streptomyces sp.]
MSSQIRGGTRWKRFALVMVPSVVATAAVGIGLAQGALAASFSVSGQSFKVSAEYLDGHGFSQYGGIDAGYAEMKGDKKTLHPVAISSFRTAEITKMCQSVVTPNIPLLGSVSLQLKAGDNGTPVSAENLYIDVADLQADAEFSNIDIGVAAKDAAKGPAIKAGENINENGFAQQADRAQLRNVKQTAWATTAGTFKLSGLSMKLYNGVKECY